MLSTAASSRTCRVLSMTAAGFQSSVPMGQLATANHCHAVAVEWAAFETRTITRCCSMDTPFLFLLSCTIPSCRFCFSRGLAFSSLLCTRRNQISVLLQTFLSMHLPVLDSFTYTNALTMNIRLSCSHQSEEVGSNYQELWWSSVTSTEICRQKVSCSYLINCLPDCLCNGAHDPGVSVRVAS